MNLILRNQLPIRPLPGRGIQLVAGKENSASPSNAVTMGFAHYSVEYGPMSPHRHAEEIVFFWTPIGVMSGWAASAIRPTCRANRWRWSAT